MKNKQPEEMKKTADRRVAPRLLNVCHCCSAEDKPEDGKDTFVFMGI